MIDKTLLLVGSLAFLLHFIGRWQSTTDHFIPWITTKANAMYFTSAILLCALSLFLEPELAVALGMQHLTYAAVMCYGGGHFIGRFFDIKEAATEKKAINDNAAQ